MLRDAYEYLAAVRSHPMAGEPFSKATEGVAPAVVAALARGEWIGRGENVLLAGPIGTGKTHLAIALGLEGCRRRPRRLLARGRAGARARGGARRARARTAAAPDHALGHVDTVPRLKRS